jgi:hypothetical protein
MRPLAALFLVLLGCSYATPAKTRIAVLAPDGAAFSVRYARALENSLDAYFRVLDGDMAASAYASLKIEDPFNQTAASAKSIGTVIGCEHYILLRAATSRRSSSASPNYFEASAFIFLVDSRSGGLVKFIPVSKQAETAESAENLLLRDTSAAAGSVDAAISEKATELQIEYEMFDDDSKTMRPAMPYSRIKPQYTELAFLHDVKAIVEAEVSIDIDGSVRKVDVVRWAGFGLDQAVVDAVNKMNWRRGERGGKPLPMRVLLRYNFTKIAKEPQ